MATTRTKPLTQSELEKVEALARIGLVEPPANVTVIRLCEMVKELRQALSSEMDRPIRQTVTTRRISDDDN